jgi:hypothetical protein
MSIDWNEIADAFAAGGAPAPLVADLRAGQVAASEIQIKPEGWGYGVSGKEPTALANALARGKKATLGVRGGWSDDVDDSICYRVLAAITRRDNT